MHPERVLFSTAVIFLGRDIFSRLMHPANAFLPILSTESSGDICFSFLQSSNACAPISLSLSERITFSRLKQWLKAYSSIIAVDSGRTRVVNDMHPANAYESIFTSVFGRWISFRFLQLKKAYSPM